MTVLEDFSIYREESTTSEAVRISNFTEHLHELKANRTPQPPAALLFFRQILLAGAIGTAEVVSFPAVDFQRPGSVAHMWVDRRRIRRSITAAEARAMALQVMEDTELHLQRGRVMEAKLLAQIFHGDELLAV